MPSKPDSKPPFLRFWRVLTGTEKQQLSKRSGLAYSHLSNLAHGRRTATLDTLAKLRKADQRITVEMLWGRRARAIR